MICHTDRKYLYQRYYLEYANFLCLSDKKSVIVKAIITIHALGKQGENKAVKVLTILFAY